MKTPFMDLLEEQNYRTNVGTKKWQLTVIFFLSSPKQSGKNTADTNKDNKNNY